MCFEQDQHFEFTVALNFRNFSDIGKTIFLTVEEVEIALKNRIGKENNE